MDSEEKGTEDRALGDTMVNCCCDGIEAFQIDELFSV